MEEIWKDIEGYEGYYQVSNIGNVKSLERFVRNPSGGYNKLKSKPMAKNNKSGYLYLTLSKNWVKNNHHIHRLVASAFIENPENKPHVNHINGVKNDNRVENLEWCSVQENIDHAWRVGLTSNYGETSTSSKLTEGQAKEIKYNHKGLTEKQIARIYGIARQTVNSIRIGKSWKHI